GARASRGVAGALGVGLEAGEPVVDVRNEAGLAHPAVVDDVDAELGLLLDDLPYRPPHPGGERLRVVGPAGGLGLDQLEQIARARQAPRVRCQDAVGAVLHGVPQLAGLMYS